MNTFNKRALCKELDIYTKSLVSIHNNYKIKEGVTEKILNCYFLEMSSVMEEMLNVISATKEKYITSSVLDMVELEILNAKLFFYSLTWLEPNDINIVAKNILSSITQILNAYKQATGETVPLKPYTKIPMRQDITLDINKQEMRMADTPLIKDQHRFLELDYTFNIYVLHKVNIHTVIPFKYTLRVDDISKDFDLKFLHVKRALLSHMDHRLKLDIEDFEIWKQTINILKLERSLNNKELEITLEYESNKMRHDVVYGM